MVLDADSGLLEGGRVAQEAQRRAGVPRAGAEEAARLEQLARERALLRRLAHRLQERLQRAGLGGEEAQRRRERVAAQRARVVAVRKARQKRERERRRRVALVLGEMEGDLARVAPGGREGADEVRERTPGRRPRRGERAVQRREGHEKGRGAPAFGAEHLRCPAPPRLAAGRGLQFFPRLR